MHSSQEREVCEQNSDLFLCLSSIGIAEFHRKDKKEGRKTRDWKIAVFPERAPRVAPLLLPPSLPSFLFLPSGYYGGGTREADQRVLPPSLRRVFIFGAECSRTQFVDPRSPSYKNGTFAARPRPPARSPSFRSISLLNFLLGSRGALFRSVCLSRFSSFGQVFFRVGRGRRS